jgi:integrase/recombinase XerC
MDENQKIIVDAHYVKVLGTENWWNKYDNWLFTHNKSINTRNAYVQDLRSFSNWFWEVNGQELTPDLITGVDLRAYRAWEVEEVQVRPATWNRRRSSLGEFCKWAMEAGYLNYNPFIDVEPMDEIELPPRWLEKKDFQAFMRQVELEINTAKSDYGRWQAIRDQAIIALMIYAGLREGEVVALMTQDIELSERKGRVIIKNGKGEKRREIPLNKEARRALSLWLKEHSGGYLFISHHGGELSTRSVQRRVAEIGKIAGIEVTPHDLRHTFAKRMLDAGVPLTTISKLLGHARLETTKRYVQPGWGDYERAVEKI